MILFPGYWKGRFQYRTNTIRVCVIGNHLTETEELVVGRRSSFAEQLLKIAYAHASSHPQRPIVRPADHGACALKNLCSTKMCRKPFGKTVI
ncbi:hypothetical protein QTP88_008142 [Uroleucon formosanum]